MFSRRKQEKHFMILCKKEEFLDTIPKVQFIKENYLVGLTKFKTYILENTIKKIKNKPQTRENDCKSIRIIGKELVSRI